MINVAYTMPAKALTDKLRFFRRFKRSHICLRSVDVFVLLLLTLVLNEALT